MPLSPTRVRLRLFLVSALSLSSPAARGASNAPGAENGGDRQDEHPIRPGEALIRYELSPEHDLIRGSFQYELPQGLPVLVLHPNAYAEPPDALTDVRYRWLYPGPFSAGGLTLTGLWVDAQATAGAGLQSPTETAVPLPLPTDVTERLYPLPSLQGVQGVLRGTFETRIPKRFGTFGRYRDQVTLEGGFFPLLAVGSDPGGLSALHLPVRHFVLTEGASQQDSRALHREVVGTAPYFVHRGTPALEAAVTLPEMPPVHIRWMPWSGERRRMRLQRVVTAALRDWHTEHPGAALEAEPPIVLEQAPLRDDLTYPVDGAVLVSDRLYRVSALFADFHDLELRRRIFEQLYLRMFTQNSAIVAAGEAAWLSEVLAWKQVQATRSGNGAAPSIQDRLGLFTVIPIIDRLLHNPNYPMGATYAQSLVRTDLFSQHLASTLGGETSGPLLVHRLEALLGAEAVAHLLKQVLEPDAPSFISLLEGQFPQALPLVQQWRMPPQEGNYALELNAALEAEKGQLLVTVTRDPGLPVEPLTLQIETRPSLAIRSGRPVLVPANTQYQHVWFGTPGEIAAIDSLGTHRLSSEPAGAAPSPSSTGAQERTLRLSLDQPLKRVILDPEQRLLEPTRADNQYPVEWNWLLWDFLFSNNGTLDGQDSFLSFLINLHYKDTLLSRRILELEGWSQEESFGAALGYLHYFGKKRTVYRWEHELSARLEYRNLNQAFELEQVVGGEHIQPLDASLTLRGGYSFENRLNPYTPIRGAALDLKGMVGVGITEAGSLSDSFGAVSLHVRRLFPITEVHGLAARMKVETFLWGNAIPEMNTFLLGGEEDLRSLPPRATGGLSKVLVSLEDRHPLLLDLDLNLILFRLREARGVAFVDAGFVAEQGFQNVTGDALRLAIGYGLRFNIDLFGLSPLLFAVNVALPLDSMIRESRLPNLEDVRRMESSYHAF